MIGFMHWNPKFDPHPTEDASNLEDMESLFQNCVVQGYIFIQISIYYRKLNIKSCHAKL